MKSPLCIVLICTFAAAQSGDAVLAPGNPTLTQRMVNDAIAVWETFLELKFTGEQRRQLQQVIVDAWRRGDRKKIQDFLGDLKYVGKDDDLRAARDSNQAAFVEGLRRDPRDPANAIFLTAYNAAHPDRGEVMQARGLGQLVGEWQTGGAILPARDRTTGRLQGIRASDSLVLNIFSDGRFHHLWAHSHCDSGDTTCCRESSTSADGAISVEGSKLVLEATSGNELFKAPCLPKANLFQPIQQRREVLDWSVRRDPGTGTPKLCLARQPFNPQWNQQPGKQPGAVCYLKQR